MTEWTSISVTEEQKAALQAHKPENVAMGRFLVDAIDGDTDTEAMSVDATDVQDALGLPDEAIPDDLQDRVDRIEAGVREATNAAQSADKKLEGLGR